MDWLARQAEARPGATALVSGEERLTYRELAAAAARGAHRLAGLGIEPGAVLAWEACATLPALVWLHAALWSGAMVAPFRAGSSPETRRSLVARTGAIGVLSAGDDPVADAAGCRAVSCGSVPPDGGPARPPAPIDPERVLTLLQTSGSGGPAKLVALRARQHAASVGAITRRLDLSADDQWLLCLPLQHVGGLAIVLRAALTGACVRLHERFDAERVADALVNGTITHVSLVPTMLVRIIESLKGAPARSLRCVLVGGGGADPRLLRRARALGLPVVPTWGMTEAASQLATPSPAEAAAIDYTTSAGIAGRPLDGVEVRPADGRVAELEVRGPMLFDGYADGPGGPDADGWFATGDRGFVDADGFLYIVGRSADRIITGGENVDALAVERALREAGLVDDVRVLGVPDDQWGERVAAVCVTGRTTDALADWARAHLDPQQRPRLWRIVERLPRTDSGKLDRDVLLRLLQGPAQK